jgi:hypothetical protein
MDESKMYFNGLEVKFAELLNIGLKKKYQFFAPAPKYINSNMLNKAFYENHIFFQSDYEPNLFVSLSGKVLQYKKNLFESYLGFKKFMLFNVVGESYREVNIQGVVGGSNTIKVINIDNVIDEACYNPPTSNHRETVVRKDSLVRYSTKQEYLQFYKNSLQNNKYEFREVDEMLNEACRKLMNDYILIKKYIFTYSKYFKEAFTPIKEVSIYRLNYINVICYYNASLFYTYLIS